MGRFRESGAFPVVKMLAQNLLTKEKKVQNFLTHELFQAALPKQDLKPDLPESLFNDLYQVHLKSIIRFF